MTRRSKRLTAQSRKRDTTDMSHDNKRRIITEAATIKKEIRSQNVHLMHSF